MTKHQNKPFDDRDWTAVCPKCGLTGGYGKFARRRKGKRFLLTTSNWSRDHYNATRERHTTRVYWGNPKSGNRVSCPHEFHKKYRDDVWGWRNKGEAEAATEINLHEKPKDAKMKQAKRTKKHKRYQGKDRR